jgi:hypothetical protein
MPSFFGFVLLDVFTGVSVAVEGVVELRRIEHIPRSLFFKDLVVLIILLLFRCPFRFFQRFSRAV